jgi:hypothetical protein
LLLRLALLLLWVWGGGGAWTNTIIRRSELLTSRKIWTVSVDSFAASSICLNSFALLRRASGTRNSAGASLPLPSSLRTSLFIRVSYSSLCVSFESPCSMCALWVTMLSVCPLSH